MLRAIILLAAALCLTGIAEAELAPWPENPRYWALDGEPVLLLGGSVDDNLFQIENLEEHLDTLKAAGGNYVRNTMSSRDAGNVWPFAPLGGAYDLQEWNPEYWSRFQRFLELTAERDIVVQIEVWATFDYYRDIWARNPFNPKNNVNYTSGESGLPEAVDSHPLQCENNFFWSVPAERNQIDVLTHQRRFVDKLLSHAFAFGHVLYCMDNETAVTPEWGAYWSRYIQDKALEQGKTVQTTEMWDPWDLDHPKHNATFDHPELYSFADISQNNHKKGQTHWDNAQKQRDRIADAPRPLNNVKVYGAGGGRFGNAQDGLERFWRNVIGGMASTRFHRPDAGIGLSPLAQTHIQSARMLADALNIFTCKPDNAVLSGRAPNEAYCTARPGEAYAVYFPDGGEATLECGEDATRQVRWLDISKSEWRPPVPTGGASLELACPSPGHWAALITPAP